MDVATREVPTSNTNATSDTEPFQPASPAPTGKESHLKMWLRDVAISAAISVMIIAFLYQPVRVEGTSMMPRLENHDRLFINKFVYDFSSIKRGDVVVFHYPLDPAKSYIKRVIGLPGDHIQIIDGYVWVNGKKLHEPYVPARYRGHDSMPLMKVPKGYYFVMGDHRSISYDSRAFGPVKRSLIYGKAEFIYWPAKDAGAIG